MTADDMSGGGASAMAAVLATPDGRQVFVKGALTNDPQAEELDLEHRISSHLPNFCPRTLWRVETAGWLLIAFEAIAGTHADYAPNSPDLESVTHALTVLSGTTAPPLPLLSAWDRWGYYCADDDEPLLHGETLLHTDLAATNILMLTGQARVIDWAWAATGPAWADTALWAARLISDGGHSTAEAARWAHKMPAFRTASPRAVAVLTQAEASRWADLAADGTPGIEGITRGSRLWADYWMSCETSG
ncbi:aminoglycoside phosphotransferase [Streptomyces sp. H27-C3]|uniref:aminoglycoside phosphotransferase n=1 Tax=Streptomyces sp. H27-C3 TaxID=3046305 RepID=UPI0024B9F022|nr:aminoglycoside phosphotransferase [Streptomyces sp. H27-C3]MDJ0463096.1 aminoglycoside phosphotransferase [Streptomyces sp. H27-C3]